MGVWLYVITMIGIPATIFNTELAAWIDIGLALGWFAFAYWGYTQASADTTGTTQTQRTYLDEKSRRRCLPCKKIIFSDKYGAEIAAQKAKSRGTTLRSYYDNGNYNAFRLA